MSDCTSIDGHNAGRRLDAFVRQLLPDIPLGVIMKWLRRGFVRVNAKRARPDYRLQLDDVVSVPSGLTVDRWQPKPAGVDSRLTILFEDNDLLVLDKPSGLAAHPGTGHEHDSLMSRVIDYLGAAEAAPGRRPGLVQRLDRDVSGVLIVGKNATALRALHQAVLHDTLDKRYLALAAGDIAADQEEITLPLRINATAPRHKPKVEAHPEGKPAHTSLRVLDRLGAATLVELRIHTGHNHQIRAHLRAIDHPIVGDPRYGPAPRCDLGLGLSRPFLHAHSVSLQHPCTAKSVTWSAPLADDLEEVLARLRAQKTLPCR